MRNQLIVAAVTWFVVSAAYGGPLSSGGRRKLNAEPVGWRKASTVNFDVFGQFAEAELLRRADRLESLRKDLGRKWLTQPPAAWTPRCAVVIHPTSRSYLAAVPGGEFTDGSSIVDAEDGRIAVRRIDLRPAPESEMNGTLAHELMHVMLAEYFAPRRAPAWAEEGIAVLEDSAERRRQHRQNLLGAMQEGKALSLRQLFEQEPVAPSERLLMHYGLGASIVEFLVGRSSPPEFVRFIEIVHARDYSIALQKVYGFDGLTSLRQAWLQALYAAP